MSTSFLYHSSKVQGVIYEKTIYEKDRIIFKVRPKDSLFVCPKCKSDQVVRNGGKERLIRNLKMGRKTTFVQVFQSRLRCRNCSASSMMLFPFVDKWKNYTRAVALEAWDLSKAMTLQDVADYLGMDWRAVKEIQKKKLKARFDKPSLSELKHIGIDEICIGKGHKYITVVIDLISGRVVYMGKGKSSESLLPFWKSLERSKAKIEAVAIDMAPAYVWAVKEFLPDAVIVFDHFHVIKLFN
jgi:transposase